MLRAYIAPDYHAFSFFPWAAYLAFGMSAGSVIRVIPAEAMERAMQWAALGGGALIFACQYFSNLPFSIYTNAEYWLNSPAQMLTKLGRDAADRGVRVPVDAVRDGRRVELGAAVRHDVAAGVLGAYRAGVRALVRLLEGRAERGADGGGGGRVDRHDAGAVGARTNFARIRAWFEDLVWGAAARPDAAAGD